MGIRALHQSEKKEDDFSPTRKRKGFISYIWTVGDSSSFRGSSKQTNKKRIDRRGLRREGT